MHVTLVFDPSDHLTNGLHFHIQTWLLMFARDECRISEAENEDGYTVLTFDFREILDAADFMYCLHFHRYVRQT